jgi:uncharacterized membrane protein YeiH
MTAFAVIFALVTALCIGYHVGRRAGSTPSTWKKRTSWALGRLAMSLMVLLIARRIRQSFRTKHTLADAVGICGLKFVESLRLPRGGARWRRAHSRLGLRHQLPF